MSKRDDLVESFRNAINLVSRENVSQTPDFILAEVAMRAIEEFEVACTRREEWYGYSNRPCQTAPTKIIRP